MSEEDKLIKALITDLVTLAIRTNNVVIQGQFPASISDNVSALLTMCKEIHDEWTIRPESTDSGDVD